MSSFILADTSFLVAQLDKRDLHHARAKGVHAQICDRDFQYLYLDIVINETVSVLTRRAIERKSDPSAILHLLRQEIPVEMLVWTGAEWPRLWKQIFDLIEEYKGQLSFNDCLMVLVAQEANIKWIASFDKGFDKVVGLKRIFEAELAL